MPTTPPSPPSPPTPTPPKKRTKINWDSLDRDKFRNRIKELRRGRRATDEQIDAFVAWREEDPDVPDGPKPEGDWFADFGGFIIAGTGSHPSTPLEGGSGRHGEQVYPPQRPTLTDEEREWVEKNPSITSAAIVKQTANNEAELKTLNAKQPRSVEEEKRIKDLMRINITPSSYSFLKK